MIYEFKRIINWKDNNENNATYIAFSFTGNRIIESAYLEYDKDEYVRFSDSVKTELVNRNPGENKPVYSISANASVKWLNLESNKIIQNATDYIGDNLFKVEFDDRFGIIRYDKTVVLNSIYDNIEFISNTFVVVLSNHIGLIDKEGQIIIPVRYKSIESVRIGDENVSIYWNGNYPYGEPYQKQYSCQYPFDTKLNKDHDIICHFKVSLDNPYSNKSITRQYAKKNYDFDSPLILKNESKASLFWKERGGIIIDGYDDIFPLKKDLYVLRTDGQYDFWYDGITYHCNCHQVKYYGEDYLVIRYFCEWMIVRLEGRNIVSFIDDEILDLLLYDKDDTSAKSDIEHYKIMEIENSDWLEINSPLSDSYLFDEIVPTGPYFSVKDSKGHYALLNKNYTLQIYRGNNRHVIDSSRYDDRIWTLGFEYRHYDVQIKDEFFGLFSSHFVYYSDDMILASINNKYGFINDKNQTVVQFKYDYVEERVDGNFNIKLGSAWGVLSNSGKEIVPLKYLYRVPTIITDAIVQDAYTGCYNVLKPDGTEKLPHSYDQLRIEQGIIFVGYGGHYEDNRLVGIEWGALDAFGNELLPCSYYNIEIKGNYLLASKDVTMCIQRENKIKHELTEGQYLFDRNGNLIIGGFQLFSFKDDKEDAFILTFGGYWETETIWDNPVRYNSYFRYGYGKTLKVDAELRVLINSQPTDLQLDKGFQIESKIKEGVFGETVQWNIPDEYLESHTPNEDYYDDSDDCWESDHNTDDYDILNDAFDGQVDAYESWLLN